MENVKVKIFETSNRQKFEDAINHFLNEEIEDCDLIDIKLHVDPHVNPEWEINPTYFAMVLYR